MGKIDWTDSMASPWLAAEAMAAKNAVLMQTAGVSSDVRLFEGLRPTCAFCSKPVDRFIPLFDADRSRYLLRFQCHGREETVPLDKEVTLSANFAKLISIYRPFSEDLKNRQREVMVDANGETIALAYIPKGATVAYRSPWTGKTMAIPPPPERPSPTYVDFMASMINDIKIRFGWKPDDLLGEPYDPEPEATPPPPNYLLPEDGPRVIRLKD